MRATAQSLSADYDRIEKAIRFLEQNFRSQPGLRETAASAGLSEFHFQRIFRRWAGISPKRFLQFLTVEYAKRLLEESKSLLEVTYDAGLSSPSRLHDLFVAVEAVSPGEFKSRGAGLAVRYGMHPTPFGECLLSCTDKGICGLVFITDGARAPALADLKRRWPGARFLQDPAASGRWARQIFRPDPGGATSAIPLFLKGTNFQLKVWEALLSIRQGTVVSYSDLGRRIGEPRACRAVAGAVAQNPIAFLIPCHRVIRSTGLFADYRWGSARKKAMLGWEAAERTRSDKPEAVNE